MTGPEVTASAKHAEWQVGEPSWILSVAPPTTIIDLFGGTVPFRPRLGSLISVGSAGILDIDAQRYFYTYPARSPVSLLSAKNDDTGNTQSILVGSPMKGMDALNLLASIAPYKTPVARTPEDFTLDYDALFTPGRRGLRNKHVKVPGWSAFLESSRAIREIVGSKYSTPRIPVLRWERNFDGTIKIIDGPLDEDLGQALADTLGYDPSTFNTGLGLVLLGAYSPGQTNFPPEESLPDTKRTNPIMSLQTLLKIHSVVAQAREAEAKHEPNPVPPDQDLQLSPLFNLMDSHIEKNTRTASVTSSA